MFEKRCFQFTGTINSLHLLVAPAMCTFFKKDKK